MRIWIDCAHPPHALFFGPIAQLLEEHGHEVRVTARDSQQTLELARERWPGAVAIGGVTPRTRPAKAAAIAQRVTALVRWARSWRPELALSHNSYAQIVAARRLRIRAVTAMDFEFQQANHLAFRFADLILLPEAVPRDAVRRQGATPTKTRTYGGLKEEIYLGEFDPSHDVLAELGVERPEGTVIVVARTPPSRASYHRVEDELFFSALRVLGRQSHVRLVVLVRHEEQRRALEELSLPTLTVPSRAVDSRALVYAADVVLGGGGTMTREAALMGIPTFSTYAAAVPAVDRWLEQQGVLRRLTAAGQLADLRPREHDPRSAADLRARSRELTQQFVALALNSGER
jgi:uncharacterized protein